MSISENIIKYREQKGWSQQKLAKEAGISQASIHYWEKGERIPKSKSIAQLASALSVNYNDIDTEGETYISFRPQLSHHSKLFAGSTHLNSSNEDLKQLFQEQQDIYQNIIFDWADIRGYEYIDHSERITISKNNLLIDFTDEDLDQLQDFVENYLDVQIERKIKALKK